MKLKKRIKFKRTHRGPKMPLKKRKTKIKIIIKKVEKNQFFLRGNFF